MLALAETIVPPMDPFGLPASPGLFVVLIIATMLTHFVFMNFVLGGSIVATVLDVLTIRGRGDHNEAVRIIWQIMPVAMSFTITTGVAPLLFVQILYGHVFYSANVLMGYTWLMIIPLLLAGFYLIYFLTFKLGNALRNRVGEWDRRPARRLPVSCLVALIALSVAWILLNNHMLSLQPSQWPVNGAWKQTRLMVTPGVSIPRYLHFVSGAVAVSGLWIALLGRWRGGRGVSEPTEAEAITRTGLRVIGVSAGVTAIFGAVFLFSMPFEVLRGLFSLSWLTILWFAALVGVAVQFVLLYFALREPARAKWLVGLAITMLATVTGMLAGRERVRMAFLADPQIGFKIEDWAIHPQNSSFALFAITLVVTLAAAAWLIYISARAPAESKAREHADH